MIAPQRTILWIKNYNTSAIFWFCFQYDFKKLINCAFPVKMGYISVRSCLIKLKWFIIHSLPLLRWQRSLFLFRHSLLICSFSFSFMDQWLLMFYFSYPSLAYSHGHIPFYSIISLFLFLIASSYHARSDIHADIRSVHFRILLSRFWFLLFAQF